MLLPAVYRPLLISLLQDENISFISDFCLGRQVVFLVDFNLLLLDWREENATDGYVLA